LSKIIDKLKRFRPGGSDEHGSYYPAEFARSEHFSASICKRAYGLVVRRQAIAIPSPLEKRVDRDFVVAATASPCAAAFSHAG
jgi:hypothetical protein